MKTPANTMYLTKSNAPKCQIELLHPANSRDAMSITRLPACGRDVIPTALFLMALLLDAGGTRSVVLLAFQVGLAEIQGLQFELCGIDGGFGVFEL